MAHRELKRVPLDFDYPLGKVWDGYLCPDDIDIDDFIGTEPPKGNGYQLWETVSEGSPSSPVFKTAEELAKWCETNATIFASEKCSYDKWLKMFKEDSVEIGSFMIFNRSSGYIGSVANEPEEK